MNVLFTIIVTFFAGMGAGLGTGFAGMSAAAVISPMLITFLGMDPYMAVGIALSSDVLASAVSAYTYHKNKNLDVKNGDIYTVNGKAVDAHQANEVIKARIQQISQYIVKSFSYCDKEIPRTTPIILTGGGLTYLRGGADWLATQLCKPVRVYDSVNPQTKRNEYTSCYGLISEAIKTGTKSKGLFSFFRK